MTEEPNPQEIAFVEMLAAVPAISRLWYEILTACINEGMTPAQALRVVCAYAHGMAGGKLET